MQKSASYCGPQNVWLGKMHSHCTLQSRKCNYSTWLNSTRICVSKYMRLAIGSAQDSADYGCTIQMRWQIKIAKVTKQTLSLITQHHSPLNFLKFVLLLHVANWFKPKHIFATKNQMVFSWTSSPVVGKQLSATMDFKNWQKGRRSSRLTVCFGDPLYSFTQVNNNAEEHA